MIKQMREPKFKIGDEVWYPSDCPRQVRVTCPVCFGKLEVTVILGNDTRVMTPCAYCDHGYEGPLGYTLEYENDPKPMRLYVDSIHYKAGLIEYRASSSEGSAYQKEEEFFTSEADCLPLCAQKYAERVQWQKEHEAHGKNGTVRSVSWQVGHHRQQAKAARWAVEYHEARAKEVRRNPVKEDEP
jgi:hypothetical protein